MSQSVNRNLGGEALPAGLALIVPEYDGSPSAKAIWAHEYFHYLQFIGTETGRFISFAASFFSLGLSWIFSENPTFKNSTTLFYPIFDWAVHEKGQIGEELRESLIHVLPRVALLDLVLGFLPPAVNNEAWGPMPWVFSTHPPKGLVMPVITTREGDNVYLGSHAILECSAAIESLEKVR